MGSGASTRFEAQTHNNPILAALLNRVSIGQLERVIDNNLASLNDPDCSGYLPLYYAASNKCQDVFELLLAKGARLEERTNGCSMLHYAVLEGKLDLVDFLVSNDVPMDIVNNEGESPLQLAERLKMNGISDYLTNRLTRNATSSEDVLFEIGSSVQTGVISPLHQQGNPTKLVTTTCAQDSVGIV